MTNLRPHIWVLLLAAVGLIYLASQYEGSWQVALPLFFGMVLIARWTDRRRVKREAKVNPSKKLDASGLTMEECSLVDAISSPVFVLDREGGITYANPISERTFGSIMRGQHIQARFRAPEVIRMIDDVIQSGQPGIVEFHERVPTERWFKVEAAPIVRERPHGPTGKIGAHYLLQFRDQSEVRLADRMRSDFIANASHELRTPLASLTGFIETLQGPAKDDPKARTNFLGIMQEQAGRMARLIDDLLSLSRIEMKSHRVPDGEVDLVPLLKQLRDSMSILAEDVGVDISISSEVENAMVRADRDELLQVFENLLENACKYGGSGGKIDVHLKKEESGAWSVTVRDYGPGIPEEHLPRLTERFYRVDVDTSRQKKGTGLGLAIVKHILNRHRAQLKVRSTLGEGASFSVQFPPQS
ncbi:MAG: phosphate regulon sensor histidine kinase PhoR [Pseudomonadota bacterium]